jgi:murein DD-endopeptidase MepM/ murein hydrolase activator NlpD
MLSTWLAVTVLALTLLIVRFVSVEAEPVVQTSAVEATPSASEPLVTPLAVPAIAADEHPTAQRATAATRPVAVAPLPVANIAEPALPAKTAPPDAPSLLAEAASRDETALSEVAAATEPAAPELIKTAVSVTSAPIAAKEPVQPDVATASSGDDTRVDSEQKWLEHKVAKGESLARIFSSYGLDRRVLHGIVNSSEDAGKLANIRPGQTIRLLLDGDRSLESIELQRNRVETLRVSIDDDQYAFEHLRKDVEVRVSGASGLIESSLFVDGQRAGLSDGLIMELANIFGWDIDFALEIRAGDEFRVVFEEHYLDGEKLRDGPILAAEFTNRGETFRAIRYETPDGEIGYYDDEGHSKRRAFIRTPIKFARISSGFNPKRWHPVLKKWRSHKGVDYAAPTGTPIRASGDGKVIFRGTKGGYGRTVILQHAGKYTTLYAHMSKYASKASQGARVKQGQIIGYVGKSGLASGPHLHYEFRVNGVHKDPLKVKLPKSLALPKSEIARFKQAAKPLLAQLDSIRAETLLASNESGTDIDKLPR